MRMAFLRRGGFVALAALGSVLFGAVACTTILGFDKSVESADETLDAHVDPGDGSSTTNPPPSDRDGGTKADGGDDFDATFPEDDAGPIVVEPYLDPAFGGAGTGRFRAEGVKPGVSSEVRGVVARAADGAIWVTVYAKPTIFERNMTVPGTRLYRLKPDGSVDATMPGVADPAHTYRVLLPDGSGMLGIGGIAADKNLVARYTAAGTLDASFGDKGIQTKALPPKFSAFVGGAFEGASTLRLWGVKAPPSNGTPISDWDDLFSITYDRTTNTFGTDVATTNGFFKGSTNASPIFSPVGMTVIDGTTLEFFGLYGPFASGSPRSYGFFRLKNGAPDTSFGSGGLVTYHLDDQQVSTRTGAVAGGKLLVASSRYDYDNGVLGRFSLDGVPDPTFGDGGFVRLSAPTAPLQMTELLARAVLPLPDGKILVAGAAQLAGGGFDKPSRIVIARLDASGKIDPSFADGGYAMPTMEKNPTREEALALAREDDGHVIVVGQSENAAGGFDVFAVRLNP